MGKVVYTVQRGVRLSAIPSEIRRKFAWLFSYSGLQMLLEDGLVLVFAEDSDEKNSQLSVSAILNDIRILVEYPSDLAVVRRFSSNGYYEILPLSSHSNLIVLDFGSYIGYSSLFFAALNNVSRVFSYELSPDTYKRAMCNIGINNGRIDVEKINSYDYGIGAITEDKEITVFHEAPFFNALDALECNTYFATWSQWFNLRDKRSEKVRYCAISEVVKMIRASHGDNKLFVKIDTEGQEQDILAQLLTSELAPNIIGVVGESHKPGLENIFDRNVFNLKFNEGYARLYGSRFGYFSAWQEVV